MKSLIIIPVSLEPDILLRNVLKQSVHEFLWQTLKKPEKKKLEVVKGMLRKAFLDPEAMTLLRELIKLLKGKREKGKIGAVLRGQEDKNIQFSLHTKVSLTCVSLTNSSIESSLK